MNITIQEMTNSQIVKEIHKTDKVCENFIATAKKVMAYNDITNNAKYRDICKNIKTMIEDYEAEY